MTQKKIFKVVIAGGTGSRLWPLSRQAFPKQFHSLASDSSMIVSALKRAQGKCTNTPIIVGNEEHRFLITEALEEAGIDSGHIILEPAAKNTAPAILLAALQAIEEDSDAWLLVLPADHWIANEGPLVDAIENALNNASVNDLITFGIKPTRPDTGYGYIQADAVEEGKLCQVNKFVEKPELEKAREYVRDGTFLWNSGMFLLPAKALVNELSALAPKMLSTVQQAFSQRSRDGLFLRPEPEAFKQSPADSIDYAVMEKTEHTKVIPLGIQWSDIGSWKSYLERGQSSDVADAQGNLCEGNAVAHNCRNSLLMSRKRLIAGMGLENVAVIETEDAVLVMPIEQAQNVKGLLAELRSQGHPQSDIHAKVYRPWGTYETVDHGERYQVKRITVKPGAELSLQMHHHRAEHWIIVSGTAKVTRDDETYLLSENESTYIPLGAVHRIENPGTIPLEFIEVQSGSYLGEDDIVRFQDHYGRA